jgi:hypothetical protein
MAQLLKWLMLITKAMGMCLMNEYSVVKDQTHSSLQKEWVKVFVPSPNSR